MTALRATLALVGARARRRPGRWLLTALGLALATAFAGAVAAESTIAGDEGARSVLRGLSATQSTVRVTSEDVVTPAVTRRALALLRSLGLGAPTEVVLVNPVRLDGVVVRPAAITPLGPWIAAARPPGSCRTASCPMLLASGTVTRRRLDAPGIHFRIAGRATLSSAAPLGFTPGQPPDLPPLLLSGDASGLDALGGLSSLYRTDSWMASIPISTLHSWQLAGFERRLQQAQSSLLAHGGAFSLTAPFAGLDAARAQTTAAGQRLLLAGGGALAALALFVVLAASGLRRDVDSELRRLEAAGARMVHRVSFVAAEAGLLCGIAVVFGAAIAIAASAVLASAAGVPASGVLTHGLLTGTGAAALILAWLGTSAIVGVLLLARSPRAADVLAVAAVAALALALVRGGAADSGSGSDPLPVLLAPMACLALGVLVFRVAAAALRGGERLARRGPVLARLAFVGLARAPAAPALAIAFIAVSTGLGGFALAYRATLERGTADQAANQVPLDATVAAGSDFTTPLQVASLARWRALAGGPVMPVRRTEASFVDGGNSVVEPALGVPADALTRLHGWRSGDGSASMATLARRLVPPGPARVEGPAIPSGAEYLSLAARARGVAITVTAELRDRDGTIHPLTLGTTAERTATLRARLPREPDGPWEIEALELAEPTGLEATNGHQNGENVAAATQFTTTVRLGRLSIDDRAGRPLTAANIGGWFATGAASVDRARAAGALVHFSTSGQLGLLRPLQPSDIRPVPVLTDPQTAAAATPSGSLPLSVDGLQVPARVVGTLRRFPTLPAGTAGFVIANEETLSSALDAQLPGQGEPDELWISSSDPDRLRAALAKAPFAQLSTAVRSDIQRELRAAPIARSIVGTLVAAVALAGALAVMGLLVALLGAARDPRIESDLIAQGVGPRGLRRELRLRLMVATAFGVGAGAVIAITLTRLAVAAVRASGGVAFPDPPLVTVAPWGALAAWMLVAICALAGASWLATRAVLRKEAS
jgi:hypothetical protein